MNPEDRKLAQEIYQSFIESSISRTFDSGSMVYHFQLPLSNIREATDRQRIHESVIDFYIQYLESMNASCSYDQTYQTIMIVIDLDKCVLSPSQSQDLSIALSNNR